MAAITTNIEYVTVAAEVDALFRRINHRDENTLLSYRDDELVLDEIAALLRKLDPYAHGSDVSVEMRASARRFGSRLFALESLIAYSQAIYVAAQIEPLMQTYVDYVVARDLASMTGDENTLDAVSDVQADDDRLFCKYVMEAAPLLQDLHLRLYGISSVARIVAMINEIIPELHVENNGRGVLRIGNARRIAQHVEKLHAIYAERFRVGPMNIASIPRTGVARVLFASWQDLNQMNGLFPKDAIIERALQNAPIGEEIVAQHVEFVEALDYCAEDMRSVMSTAWIVAQRTAYMRLNQEQRETCAEIGSELRVLANDVRDIVNSHSGQIFYHGALKKKYDQLLVVDLKIAIERYSCEFV